MIEFKKYQLDTGLTVLIHEDHTTPVAVVNTLYDVGARDENPTKTGFAHLFEHLMFGGSVNIPDFDNPLQKAGGVSNAFTSNDVTNYYNVLPANNLETALWLESDRLLSLAFTEKSLEVQRSVVIEEFKQRYLNQPYGDLSHLMRSLAFQVHPYKWPTIGEKIEHIEDATMEDVKGFFFKHYTPTNAVLCIAGNVQAEKVMPLVEKWYGEIPQRAAYQRSLPTEPQQETSRFKEVVRDVPTTKILQVYHMPDHLDQNYYAVDLISDILSRGKSSRLYNKLVKEQQWFTQVNAYITGSIDPGLLVVQGDLKEGVDLEKANSAIRQELDRLMEADITEKELEKVKNKLITAKAFGDTNVLNKAMNLCFYELLGGADWANKELSWYDSISVDQIKENAKNVLRADNCSTIYYKSKKYENG